MTVYVEQTVTTTWHVDPDELRDAFPNEWMEYVRDVLFDDHDVWQDMLPPFETAADMRDALPDELVATIDDIGWVQYAFESGCTFGDTPANVDDDVTVWS